MRSNAQGRRQGAEKSRSSGKTRASAAKQRKSQAGAPAAKADDESTRPEVLKTLYQEHRYMGSLLAAVSAKLDQIEAGETLDAHVLYEAVHYLTQYPDRFHHPREDLVYQRAAEVSTILQDDVDTLQHEHDALGHSGKQLLDIISAASRGEKTMQTLISPCREYIQTLYRHMEIEEAVVFPKIEQALSAYDWELLAQEELLEPVGDPLFGPVIAREYQKIARSLRRSLREEAENLVFLEWMGIEGMLEAVDVLTMGWDNTRGLLGSHLRRAGEENSAILRQSSADITGLLLAPLRCSVANTRNYFGLVRELATLSRDLVDDIGEVRHDFRARKKMLKGTRSAGEEDRTLH